MHQLPQKKEVLISFSFLSSSPLPAQRTRIPSACTPRPQQEFHPTYTPYPLRTRTLVIIPHHRTFQPRDFRTRQQTPGPTNDLESIPITSPTTPTYLPTYL